MAKKTKEPEELKQLEKGVDEITTFITNTNKSLEKIQLTLDILREEMFIQKEIKKKEPEPVYRRESPGFKSSDGDKSVEQNTRVGDRVVSMTNPTAEPTRAVEKQVLTESLPSRRVVEYTKNNGEIGLKIQGGDVLYENKAYKYLQECKYGCGNYISFDNYKKGQKALHISPDLNVIGRYCPKYE